ncbi:hypothetical protein SE16_02000 [Ardenticatena maritima]|uniref:Uncharacterized protein n=1 Tax=Ardenticatena maritima TaxID=872965 RepID=A0A0P6YG01_9CHLR|nr:hypothetical protein SE16_02000 [Ardenticatena maritima]
MEERTVEEKIKALLAQAKDAAQEPQSHWLLPHVINVLEAMLDCLPDQKALLGAAGALGRIVTDDYAFSESPLGGELLDLVTEIVSQCDPRFRRVSGEE